MVTDKGKSMNTISCIQHIWPAVKVTSIARRLAIKARTLSRLTRESFVRKRSLSVHQSPYSETHHFGLH